MTTLVLGACLILFNACDDAGLMSIAREVWRARHRAYLQSPEWRALRQEALERDGHRCVLCNRRGQLEGHHRRYPRPWEQDCVENISMLCRACHRRFHKDLAWRRLFWQIAVPVLIVAAFAAARIVGQ